MSNNKSRLHQLFTQAEEPKPSTEDLDPQLAATVPAPTRVIEPCPDHVEEVAAAYKQLETASEDEDGQDFQDTVEGLESLHSDIAATNEEGGFSQESAYFAGLALEAYVGRLGLDFQSVEQSLESVISGENTNIDLTELEATLEGVDHPVEEVGKRFVSTMHRFVGFTYTRVKRASSSLNKVLAQAAGMSTAKKPSNDIEVTRGYVVKGDKVSTNLPRDFKEACDRLSYLTSDFAKQAAADFKANSELLRKVNEDLFENKSTFIMKRDNFIVDMEAKLKDILAKWRDPRSKIPGNPSDPIIGNFVFFEDHRVKYPGKDPIAKKFSELANHNYPTLMSYQHHGSSDVSSTAHVKPLSPKEIVAIGKELQAAAKKFKAGKAFVEALSANPITNLPILHSGKARRRMRSRVEGSYLGTEMSLDLRALQDAFNTSNRLRFHVAYDAGRALAITIRHFKKLAKLSLKAYAQASTESWDQATATDGVSVNETAPNEPRQFPSKDNQAPAGEVTPHQDTFQDKPEALQDLDGPVKASSENASPVETFNEPAEKKDEEADGEGKVVAAVKGGKPDTDQVQKEAALRGEAPTGYKEKPAADSDKASDDEKDTAKEVHAANVETAQVVKTDAALRKPAIESDKALPYWFKG